MSKLSLYNPAIQEWQNKSWQPFVSILDGQILLEVLDNRWTHSTLFASHIPMTDRHLCVPDPSLVQAILDSVVHNAQRLQKEGKTLRKLRACRNMSDS